MSSLNYLPDVEFVSADVETVEAELISEYETITGRSLAKGDPVRLFLLTIANIIVLLLNRVNETGKQNLLRYATGDNLDHLGALLGVERLAASPAVTTMQITLSAVMGNNVTIPSGTRFTADGKIFFALDDTLVIEAGDTVGTGTATCTVNGEDGNDFAIGQIRTLVDPISYVASVTNTTRSEGGAEIQSDESYREAIHIAPESFSVAGPTGAYKAFAKSASSLITDVAVYSPSPGEVDVRVLLEDGELPGEEMIRLVTEALSDRTVRPLTDNVTVSAPTVESYDVDLTYYIDSADTSQETAIRTAVEEAVADFVTWTKAQIGRDINPSELIKRIVVAGAKRVEVRAPVFTVLDDVEIGIADEITVEYGGTENA